MLKYVKLASLNNCNLTMRFRFRLSFSYIFTSLYTFYTRCPNKHAIERQLEYCL